MTPQDLIAAFETLADAPDGTTRLRELVLQLAVRGKLVPQDASDEPAAVLLERIAAEKARLVKEKKIRKPKVLPPIEADEVPFEVPEGWEWCRLGEPCITQTGATPKAALTSGGTATIAYVKPANFTRLAADTSVQINREAAQATGRIASAGSVLFVGIGGTIGKCGLATVESTFNQQIHAATPLHLRGDYLVLSLASDSFQQVVRERTSATAIPILNKTKWETIPIPIPPLAEQNRIVAKVDALMGLLDRLEAARDARDTTRASLRDAALAALSDAEDTASVGAAWTRISEHMDDLFTDPADVAPLRQTILQLAVRGRLVPQDASDEPAGVLLERIAAEKARLVKEKKIRRPKVLPPIEADEVPFEVPEGWEWCRFGLTHLFTNGFAFKSSEYQEDGVGIVRMSNLQDGEVVCRNMKYVPLKYMNELSHDLRVRPGDLLIGMSGSIGQPAFNRTSTTFLLNQRVGKVVPLFADKSFIAIFLKTIEQHYLAISFGSGIKNLSTKQIAESLCPLPPLAEQHRIVAKVDALMGLLDRLEAARDARDTTRASLRDAALAALSDAEDTASVGAAWTRISEHMDDLFTDPADVAPLRQTILQLAVRGRLVPQDASDEPAGVLLERIAAEKARLVKEKKIRRPKVLPPIEADEVPFEVPEGWEWCRFGLTHLFTNGFAFKSSEYQEDGVGIVRMSNLQDGEVVCRNMKYVPLKYMNELSHDLRVRPGDLLIGMSGSIGQPAFNRTSTTFLLNQRVGKVVPLFADKSFIAIFLKTIEQHYLAISFGSGIKNLSTKQIAESLCPLPPLAEQHRIVAKVDALMALCDDLEARLTAARTTRGAFAAAAVHHLDTE